MKEITVHVLNNDIVITGPLVQDTVMGGLAQCRPFLVSQQTRIFDFTHVTQCDSASLAFALALLRAAKSQGCAIHFSHLPDQMRDLAQVSGVTAFLPIPIA